MKIGFNTLPQIRRQQNSQQKAQQSPKQNNPNFGVRYGYFDMEALGEKGINKIFLDLMVKAADLVLPSKAHEISGHKVGDSFYMSVKRMQDSETTKPKDIFPERVTATEVTIPLSALTPVRWSAEIIGITKLHKEKLDARSNIISSLNSTIRFPSGLDWQLDIKPTRIPCKTDMPTGAIMDVIDLLTPHQNKVGVDFRFDNFDQTATIRPKFIRPSRLSRPNRRVLNSQVVVDLSEGLNPNKIGEIQRYIVSTYQESPLIGKHTERPRQLAMA